MNHRALAEEEARAWFTLYPEQRKPYRHGLRSYWKKHDPSRSGYQVVQRHAILRAKCEALWAEVEKGMPLGTAAALIHRARVQGCSIEEELQRYSSGGYITNFGDGRAMYKHKSTAPPPPPPVQEFSVEWATVRTLLEGLARRALSGEDITNVEPLLANFIIDVKEGIDALRRALKHKGEFTVSRQKVINACKFLHVQPPKPGAPVSAEFRKNAKQLRYEHHQDRLGSAYNHEYYLNIGRALDYLDAYNKMIGETT